MDSLNDIMLKKDFDEPPEITAIKSYVEREFKSQVSVAVNPKAIVITAKSSALTNSLRLKTMQLREVAKTDKRLVFRTG